METLSTSWADEKQAWKNVPTSWGENRWQWIEIPSDSKALLSELQTLDWDVEWGIKVKMLIQTFLIDRFLRFYQERNPGQAINSLGITVWWITTYAANIEKHLKDWHNYKKSPFLIHIILWAVYGGEKIEEQCERALLLEEQWRIEAILRKILAGISFVQIMRMYQEIQRAWAWGGTVMVHNDDPISIRRVHW